MCGQELNRMRWKKISGKWKMLAGEMMIRKHGSDGLCVVFWLFHVLYDAGLAAVGQCCTDQS